MITFTCGSCRKEQGVTASALTVLSYPATEKEPGYFMYQVKCPDCKYEGTAPLSTPVAMALVAERVKLLWLPEPDHEAAAPPIEKDELIDFHLGLDDALGEWLGG